MPEHVPILPADAHILVVEDKVDNYATLAKMLVYSGVRPEHCDWKSSDYGLIQFVESRNQPLDLILLDIALPHEDGYELLKRIRAHPQLQSTLVVAVTADATAENLRQAQASGFDGFLGKPLSFARFPQQLARILKGNSVWEHK